MYIVYDIAYCCINNMVRVVHQNFKVISMFAIYSALAYWLVICQIFLAKISFSLVR